MTTKESFFTKKQRHKIYKSARSILVSVVSDGMGICKAMSECKEMDKYKYEYPIVGLYHNFKTDFPEIWEQKPDRLHDEDSYIWFPKTEFFKRDAILQRAIQATKTNIFQLWKRN